MKFIEWLFRKIGYERIKQLPKETKTDIKITQQFILEDSKGSAQIRFEQVNSEALANFQPIPMSADQRSGLLNSLSILTGTGLYAGTLAKNLTGLYQATAPITHLMKYANGSVSSIVTNGGTITKHSGFVQAKYGAFAPIIILQAASIITSQYYLNGITKQLNVVNKQLNNVLNIMEANNKGKLMSAYTLIEELSVLDSYTLDDRILIRTINAEILSLYNQFMVRLRDTTENESIMTDNKFLNMQQIKETGQTLNDSNFFYLYEMACLCDKIYRLGELTYFKMLISDNSMDYSIVCKIEKYMNKFDSLEWKHLYTEEKAIYRKMQEKINDYISKKSNDTILFGKKANEYKNTIALNLKKNEKNYEEESAEMEQLTRRLLSPLHESKKYIYDFSNPNEVIVYAEVLKQHQDI